MVVRLPPLLLALLCSCRAIAAPLDDDDGAGRKSAPFSFTAAATASGCMQDAVLTVPVYTLANVSVSLGESLVLCLGTKAAGVVVPPAVVYGATSPTSSASSTIFGPSGTGENITWVWFEPPVGTANITATFPGATKPTDVCGIALTLTRLVGPGPFEDITVDATGSTAPLDTATPGVPANQTILVVNHAMVGVNGVDGVGTWLTPMQFLTNATSGDNGVRISVAVASVPASSTVPVRYTGFTDREWGVGGSLFKAH